MIKVVDYIAFAIALFSIGIIVYGTLICTFTFIRNEFRSNKQVGIRRLRLDFGGYLLLGLEILIGADILKTIVEPSYEELIVLGGIVLLRTILSAFLNREIRDLEG